MSIKKIIDISKYQDPKNINYDLLSKNIDGVILRLGYTGYGTGSSLNKDEHFERHYKEFKKRNIAIGAYYYSCADTEKDGLNEAKFVYDLIKNKEFDLPIYLDVEDEHHQKNQSKNILTKAVDTFLSYLENKGYYVGLYASSSWLNFRLDMNVLSKYTVWVAHYGVSKPSFNGKYDMWQYTSSGRLPGYNYDLDLNYLYKDFSIIKKSGMNGYKKQEEKKYTIDEIIKHIKEIK